MSTNNQVNTMKLVCFFCAISLCSCTSIEIAENNLNKLKKVTVSREKVLITQYQQQLAEQVKLVKSSYQHQVRAAKAELAYRIVMRIRQKERQILSTHFKNIDKDAEKIINESDHALSAAKAITLATGNKEAEFTAAAKLAADIGVYTYKRSEAVDKVRNRMAALEIGIYTKF